MAYLARVITLVVQSANKLHHVAHSVLRTRVKHVNFRVVEGVTGVCHGIACLPCTDGDESIPSCNVPAA